MEADETFWGVKTDDEGIRYPSGVKRGLYGTFHCVSKKHLQRYCTEFDFRWNTRQSQGWNDSDHADAALKAIAGKRLTYRRTSGTRPHPSLESVLSLLLSRKTT